MVARYQNGDSTRLGKYSQKAPRVEGPVFLVVDYDHAAYLARIAGLRPEVSGHGPGVSVLFGEGAGVVGGELYAVAVLSFRAMHLCAPWGVDCLGDVLPSLR